MNEKPLKHTPGPWTKWVGHLSVHAGVGEMDPGLLRGRGPHQPMPQIAECDDDEISMHEAISNSVLIAAAPELLEACIEALGLLGQPMPELACGNDVRSKLAAAIARATELGDDDFFAHEMDLYDEDGPEDDHSETP